MKRSLLSFLPLLIAFGACNILDTNNNRFKLEGVVTQNLEPVEGFNVEVLLSPRIYRTVTKADGSFLVDKLPGGFANVSISKVFDNGASLYALGNVFISEVGTIDTLFFPNPLTLVSAEALPNSQTRLRWTKATIPFNFNGYAVYRSDLETVNEFEHAEITTINNINDTTYTFPFDVYQQRFYYRVYQVYGQDGVIRGGSNAVAIDYE